MLGWELDVPLAEKPGSIYSLQQHFLYARALPVAQRARLWMQQVLPEVWVPAGRFAAVNRGMLTDSSRWRKGGSVRWEQESAWRTGQRM
jgi:hypothetical protein